jgi:hypothetical protein
VSISSDRTCKCEDAAQWINDDYEMDACQEIDKANIPTVDKDHNDAAL